MCKKLIILCLVLVAVGLSVPASADYIGFANPLYVDIGGAGVDPNKAGWQSWVFQKSWTGPIDKQFANPLASSGYENPIAELAVYEKPAANPAVGASRNRSGGFACVLGTGDFSPTTQGFGMNYVRLTLSHLAPDTEYRFLLWSMDARTLWLADPCNPDSKYVCWSTTNPKTWLDTNYSGVAGEPPNGGYGPKVGTQYPAPQTDSNMPAGLAALVLGRASMVAPDASDYLGGADYLVSFYATTDDSGNITVYGWIDPTDWTGSMHVPLNGFAIEGQPKELPSLYVSTSGSDDNNGLSWATAKRTVQSAINTARANDVIWVAAGTYLPTTGTDRTISFAMKQGVAIYGGFTGTETNRDQRNWVANQTILSGDIGTQGDNSDNSYHVVVGANNSVLDGFTITGGNGAGSLYSYGGGMYNNNMYNNNNQTVTNCTFSGNVSDYGGGMYNDFGSSPIVTNCTFSGNSASYDGGGMDNYAYSSPTVTNCTFRGNSAYSSGGMDNYEYSSPTVTNCTFTGNSALNGSGGGMGNKYNNSPTVTNCTFTGNSALNGSGGGMDNYEYSSPTVTNCTFTGNSASLLGGGMDNYDSSPMVTNCTFRGNSAYSGGGMCTDSFNPMVTNSIFWGNTATNGSQIYDYFSSYTVAAYSDVQGGWAGTGNINADPCFVGSGNYRLLSGSPCIDAGKNSTVPAGVTTDLDGFPRFIDDLCTTDTGNGTPPIVDMGAYEFLRSDINHDGAVNFVDFAIFASQWLQTGCGACGGADLTCDGQVNWADLRELTKWWLAGTAP